MKFFVDTADTAEIAELAATGLLDGVTTNPSLVHKAGRDFKEVVAEICHIVHGPVSAEVIALDHEGMMREAEVLRKIADHVCIKVPLTIDGLKTCKKLSADGTMVNVTLCFSANQALLAAKAGATFVSPFIGRLDDIGYDGMNLIRQIRTIYDNYETLRTEILAASIRTPFHVTEAALAGADVVLFVVEAGSWRAADSYVLEHVVAARIPIVLVVNKVDQVRPKSALLPYLEQCGARADFQAIVPVSAVSGDNLPRLTDLLAGLLPPGPPHYPLDATTDRSLSFRIAEMIREKLLIALRQEVPYGLAVEILALEEKPGVVLADAVIWADRDSHKGIVVGKGGTTIRDVGTAARLELEKIFGRKFHLETHVKVKTNWADSARTLQQFGFEAGA